MNWSSRLRNYGFWTSLAAFVLLFLHTLGVKVVDDSYNSLVYSLLALLVAAGLVNDPTQGKWFADDVKKAKSKN